MCAAVCATSTKVCGAGALRQGRPAGLGLLAQHPVNLGAEDRHHRTEIEEDQRRRRGHPQGGPPTAPGNTVYRRWRVPGTRAVVHRLDGRIELRAANKTYYRAQNVGEHMQHHGEAMKECFACAVQGATRPR